MNYEQTLAENQNQLARVNKINKTIRSVNRALVEGTDKNEVYELVSDRLTHRDLYQTVCIANVSAVRDESDSWTISGDQSVSPPVSSVRLVLDSPEQGVVSISDPERSGGWAIVPIVYDCTLYGVFCTLTQAGPIPDEEQEILMELGELIGYACNAMECRQLLSAGEVVEVTLESGETDAILAAVSEQMKCELTLKKLIPSSNLEVVAFIEVSNTSVKAVREAFLDRCSGPVRVVQSDGECGGLLSWSVNEGTLLRELNVAGMNLTGAVASGGTAEYSVEMASDQNIRRSLNRLQQTFPNTSIISKNQKHGGVDISLTDCQDSQIFKSVTERQKQMLEAAFQGGYFKWPRNTTAEEIAETFDISAATFHGHLRKAEQSVFTHIFDDDNEV